MTVSVGIPIYNAENFLDNAIKSVLNQTYNDFELLLIDDGSTDRSLEIAKKYEQLDSRVRVIHDGKNKRLPLRLNQLIQESKYDLIARMDADDIMHPERLEKQVNILNNSRYDLVSTSYFSIDSKDKIVSARIINKINLDLSDLLLGNYYILHPSIMARKSWFLNHFYNSDFDRAEDYELWFRSKVNNNFNIKIMNEPLMFYREEGSVSKNKQLKSYITTNKILDKYLKNIGFLNYLNAKMRNTFKIFIFSYLYNKRLESYLLKRRNNIHQEEYDTSKAQLILNSIIFDRYN
ncbi:glycosyltransferase family 2 protein [Acinetobacter sp. YH12049]|uniref:glycosyltransferase family 2 protein n=1 Tax=Acinetobacter sp. YH12049 TaxID=2601054 RepID=UPI0015D236FD|nr:glycosyltransferase family 2 protein [Acinetobacter sp. YH12049]